MSNSEKEPKSDKNRSSARARSRSRPEPVARRQSDSSRLPNEERPSAIVRTPEETPSAPDAMAWPNQFVDTADPGQAVPSVGDIVRSMLRFKWTILAVSILVAAPLIAAVWISFVPKYRAAAKVRVRPIIPYLVFQTEESGQIPSHIYDSFVNTQVPIISSEPVLQRVLDRQEVRQTQWHTNPPKSLLQKLGKGPTPPIGRLQGALSVVPRKDTEIIDVTFTDTSAGEAEIILNAILDQYIKHIREMSDTIELELTAQLRQQRLILEDGIRTGESTIGELQASLGTAAPQELISQKRVRLDDTQARLADTQQKIDLLRWELNQVSARDINDVNLPIATGMEMPQYHEDEKWRRLDETVSSIQLQIEISPRRPEHQEAIRLEKQLKFTEELRRKREAQLDQQWRDRELRVPFIIAAGSQLSRQEAVTYLEHQLARSEREEQLLLADVDKQQAEFNKLFESAQNLEKENTSLLHDRELLYAVRQRQDQTNMERNAPGSIEVLMRAVAGPGPYNDRRIVFSVMIAVLALGVGGGAAYLKASRSEAVYAPEDMPYPMQIPFLGYVLVTDTRRSAGRSLLSRYRQVKRDQSSRNESIRIVRTALLSRLNGHDGTAVLVTSAVAGTGKSYFTVMLGESLARAGKKVLVIDADFRKMGLTKRRHLSGRSGFIQALRRGSVHQQDVFPSGVSGLSFLPAGQRGGTDTVHEEIANGAFKTCIDKLRRHYDVILLDSSPILATADATILSSQVDGTVMVERELVSQRTNEVDALTRLASSGGRLIGTVFVGSAHHEKYGGGYS